MSLAGEDADVYSGSSSANNMRVQHFAPVLDPARSLVLLKYPRVPLLGHSLGKVLPLVRRHEALPTAERFRFRYRRIYTEPQGHNFLRAHLDLVRGGFN
jgi:hypothetical protein